MRALRGSVWVLAGIAVVTMAIALSGNEGFVERLSELALAMQLALPVTMDFDRFLVILTGVSLCVVILLLMSGAAIALVLSIRLRHYMAQALAAKQEVSQLASKAQSQFREVAGVGQVLTQRLDKQVVVEALVEATGRITTHGDVNGAVSLWVFDFERDVFRFEVGFFCDETLFMKTTFQQTEEPFAHVIATQSPWLLPSWDVGMELIRPEKVHRLGAATSCIVVPLIVEKNVLGVLAIACHPELLKRYEEQQAFYQAIWGEMTLALAVATQVELAILDRMTGVHNRDYFMKRLVEEIERANRYRLPLSLAMLDIDNFKLVNDMLGHPQGDAALKIIVKLIKKSVRAIDLIGRYGGEEFVIMMPETGYGDEASSVSGARVAAERIRRLVEEEFCGFQKPLNLTVSIGVVVRRFPEDRAMNHRELLRLVDEQLYRAKAAGKNTICALLPEKPQAVSG